MSILSSGQQPQQTSTPPASVSHAQRSPFPREAQTRRSSTQGPDTPTSSETRALHVIPPQIPTSTLSVLPFDHIKIVPGLSISFNEADSLLDRYRTYSKFCPFIPVSPSMNAWQMFERSPFLLRTILQTAAPQNAAIQRDVGRWFREYIAEHVVVNQEMRLELLQALIVYLSW